MTHARYLYWFNDKQHFRRFLLGLACLAVLAGMGVIFIPQAMAQSAAFSCTSGSANGNLFDQDTIGGTVTDASGNTVSITAPDADPSNDDPYAGGQCTQALGIVGQIMCFFKSTLGQIVSLMYCSFQSSLQGPLNILLTLFVAVIGVAIFTGMTRLTAREGIVTLLKIALVWTFATNASWGIGIGYTFFMGLAEQGANIMIGAAASGSTASGGEYLTQPDKIIGGILNYAGTGTNTGGTSPLTLSSTLTSSANSNCLAWLFFLLAMLMLAMPWVATFIITLIIQYLWLYARALLGYLTALVLISFLFVLAPLFVSFALFQTTRTLFEQWIKYLVSFSLQIVIIFGFLAMMNLVPLGNFFSEIMNLLRQYDNTNSASYTAMPVTFCNICQVTISSTATLMDATPPITCDSTGTVMPLWKAFAQMNLVQAVVSQVIALWIIGYVMLDFMQKAPEFARDLAGKLPFSASLGAGAFSQSGNPVNFVGMDSLEAFSTTAPNKFYNSSFGKSTFGRLLPGAALVGSLGALSVLGRKSGSQTADGQSADGQQATGGSGAKSKTGTQAKSGSQSSSAAQAKTSDNRDAALLGASVGDTSQAAGGKAAPSVMRAALVGNSREQYRYDAAQLKVQQAKTKMDVDAAQVRDALNVVQDYKDAARSGEIRDPLQLTQALKFLQDSNESYLIATDNLFGSQERMFKEKSALNLLKPSAEGQNTPSSFSEGLTQAVDMLQRQSGDVRIPTLPGIDPHAITYEDMRNRADTAVESLRLQLEVQRFFLPEDRVNEASQHLEDVVAKLKTTQTTYGLGEIMQQLYSVQKKLV